MDYRADSAGRLDAEVFQLAVEVCPSGLIVVGGDGRIRLVNREIDRLFGYPREELLGQSIDILLPEALRAKHAAQRRHFSHAPESRHFGTGREFNGRRKDSGEFPIEVGLHPLRLDGESMVVAAVIDLSERRRLDRMQDEFVATVSHELRTPMTSIAASLGLLLAGNSGGLPEHATHLLRIAHGNCQRLVRMVNDVLDFKKLDAGKMPFNFQRCDARALLEKTMEANQGFADDCGASMRLIAPMEPIEIYVDPDRFIQAITNLLSNALKFSPPGETVTVTIMQRASDVRITVRDRGPGIPAAFKKRMFETFAQADGGGRQKGGSGLGLSIARQIVSEMWGVIDYDDAPGGGTDFRIELPGADNLEPRQSASG